MAKARKKQNKSGDANLCFGVTRCAAADKLRGNMDAVEYKHVFLGLTFLKYISDADCVTHCRPSCYRESFG